MAKIRRLLASVLTLAMVLGVFAAFPVITYAYTYSDAKLNAVVESATVVFDGTGNSGYNDTNFGSGTWTGWSSGASNAVNLRTYNGIDYIQAYKGNNSGGVNLTVNSTVAGNTKNQACVIMEFVARSTLGSGTYHTVTCYDNNTNSREILKFRYFPGYITPCSVAGQNADTYTTTQIPYTNDVTVFRIFLINYGGDTRVVWTSDYDGDGEFETNYEIATTNAITSYGFGVIRPYLGSGGNWTHSAYGNLRFLTADFTAEPSGAAEAAQALTLPGDCSSDVTTLPTTVSGYSGFTVSWASGDASAASVSGSAITYYPSAASTKSVTLTATVTNSSNSSDTATKSFNITIHASSSSKPAAGDRITGSDGIVYEVTSATNLIDSSFDVTGQDGSGWLGRTGVAATSNAAWSQVEGFNDCYAWQSDTSAGSGNANSMNPLVPISGLTAGNYYALTFAAKSSANGTIEWSNVQLMDSSYAAIGDSIGQVTAASNWTVNSYVFSPTSESAYISPATGWVGSSTMDDFSVVALAPVEVSVTERYVNSSGGALLQSYTPSTAPYLGSTYTPNAPTTLTVSGTTYTLASTKTDVVLSGSNVTNDAITLTYQYTAEAVTVRSFVPATATVIDGNDPILPNSVMANLSTGLTEPLAVTAWSSTYTTSGNVRTYTATSYASTTSTNGYEIYSGVSAPTAQVTVLDCDEEVRDVLYTDGEVKQQLARNYAGTIYTEFDLTPHATGDVWVSYTSSANNDYFGDSATRIGIENNYFKVVYGTNADTGYAASTSYVSTIAATNGVTYRVLTYTDITNGTFSIWITDPDGVTSQLVNEVGFRRASADIGYVGLVGARGAGQWDITNHKISWSSGYATVSTALVYGATEAAAKSNGTTYQTLSDKVMPGASFTADAPASFTVGSTTYTRLPDSYSVTAGAAGTTTNATAYYTAEVIKIASFEAITGTVIDGNTPRLPDTVTATLSNSATVEIPVTWNTSSYSGSAVGSRTYTATAITSDYERASGVSLPTASFTALACDEVVPSVSDSSEGGIASRSLENEYTGVIWAEFDGAITVDGTDLWIMYAPKDSGNAFGESAARVGIDTSDGYKFKVNGLESQGGSQVNTAAGFNFTSGASYRFLTKMDTTQNKFWLWVYDTDGTLYDVTGTSGVYFRSAATTTIGSFFYGPHWSAGTVAVSNHRISWESGYGTVTTNVYYLNDYNTSGATPDVTTTKKVIPGTYAPGFDTTLTYGSALYAIYDSASTTSTTVAQGGSATLNVYYVKASDAEIEEPVVYTLPTFAPEMPDTVTATFGGSNSVDVAVTWASINSSLYAAGTAGSEFTVTGTISALSATTTATVHVVAYAGQAPTEVVTVANVAPTMPTTVSVLGDNGIYYDVPVTWNSISASSYAEVGNFTVSGTAQYFAQRVIATVVVDDGTLTTFYAIADTYTVAGAADTNYGTESIVQISSTGGSSPAGNNRYTFLRFNTSSYTSTNDVLQAKIGVYTTSINNSNTNLAFYLYAIPQASDTWDEETLTWNLQDDITSASTLIKTIYINQTTWANGWLEFDVTDYIEANAPSASTLAFYIATASSATQAHSRENGTATYAPRLWINTALDPIDVTVNFKGNATLGSATYNTTIQSAVTVTSGPHRDYTYTAYTDRIAYNNKNYFFNEDLSTTTVSVETDPVSMTLIYDYLTLSSYPATNVAICVGGDAAAALPETLNATWSDGSVHAIPVTWNTSGVNTSTVGTYSVSGTVYGCSAASATVYVCDDDDADGKPDADYQIIYVTADGSSYASGSYDHYVDASFGDVYRLSNDDLNPNAFCSVIDIYGGASSDITSLTENLTLDRLGLKAYLVVEDNGTFAGELSGSLREDGGNAYYDVSYDIFNGTDTAETALVLVGVFSEDEELLYLDLVEIGSQYLTAYMTEIYSGNNAVLSVPVDLEENQVARAFLWNKWENIKPIGDEVATDPLDDDILLIMPAYADVVGAIESANSSFQSGNSASGLGNNAAAAIYQMGNLDAYGFFGQPQKIAYYNYAKTWAAANSYNGGDGSSVGGLAVYNAYNDLSVYSRNDETMTENGTAVIGAIAGEMTVLSWNTADALLYAMPIFAREYLTSRTDVFDQSLYSHYGAARDVLYDGANDLFGTTSEANAYAIAGIARTLDELSSNSAAYSVLLADYKKIASSIEAAQTDDGTWYSDILDSASGSCDQKTVALMAYGLMKGVNAGYITDTKYLYAAIKAWNYLNGVTLASDGETVGAFLMASVEVARYIGTDAEKPESVQAVDDRMNGSVAMLIDSPYYYVDNKIYSDNLVANGDFEGTIAVYEDQNDIATTGRMLVGGRTVGMRVNDAHYGSYAYGIFDASTFTYRAELEAGENYTFSIWTKAPSSGGSFNTNFLNVYEGEEVVGRITSLPDGTWHHTEFSFTASGSGLFSFKLMYNGANDPEATQLANGNIGLIDDIELYKNSSHLAPIELVGEAWIPVYDVSTMLGYDASFSGSVLTVVDHTGGNSLAVNVSASTYSINGGSSNTMSTAVQQSGDDYYIPARIFANAFGKSISVNGDLVVIGEKETVFDDYDANLVSKLSDMLDAGSKVDLKESEVAPTPEAFIDLTTSDCDFTTADEPQEENGIANMFDTVNDEGVYSDTSTRWSVLNDTTDIADEDDELFRGSVAIDLATAASGASDFYEIDKIGIAFYDGNNRQYGFKVEYTRNGITWYELIEPQVSNGLTASPVYYYFDPVIAGSVRITVSGWTNPVTGASGNWAGVTALEIYGDVSDYTLPSGSGSVGENDTATDLSSVSAGTFLNVYGEGAAVEGWYKSLVVEDGNTDYTPSFSNNLQSGLNAWVTTVPSNKGLTSGTKAIRLYDSVARTTDATNGAGGGAIWTQFDVSEFSDNPYLISFDMYAATLGSYSGISLGYGGNSTGAMTNTAGSTSYPLAMQLRYSVTSTTNKRTQINRYRSITFNEGTYSAWFATSPNMSYNKSVHYEFLVDPKYGTIDITATAGTAVSSTTVYTASTSFETSNSDGSATCNWTNYPNTIVINTGVGDSADLYIANFKVEEQDPDEVRDEVTYAEMFAKIYSIKVSDTSKYVGYSSGSLASNNSNATSTARRFEIFKFSNNYTDGSFDNIPVGLQVSSNDYYWKLATNATSGTALSATSGLATDGSHYFVLKKASDWSANNLSYYIYHPLSGQYVGYANNKLVAAGTSAPSYSFIFARTGYTDVGYLTTLPGYQSLTSAEQSRLIDICASIGSKSFFYTGGSGPSGSLEYRQQTSSTAVQDIYTNRNSTTALEQADAMRALFTYILYSGQTNYYSLPALPGSDGITTQFTDSSGNAIADSARWPAGDTSSTGYGNYYFWTSTYLDGWYYKFIITDSYGTQTTNYYVQDNSTAITNGGRLATAFLQIPYPLRRNITNVRVRSDSANSYNCGQNDLYMRLNWTPDVASIAQYISHEFGHSMDYSYGATSGNWLSSYADKDLLDVSGYGNNTSYEDFAEFNRLYFQHYGNVNAMLGLPLLFPYRYPRLMSILGSAGYEDIYKKYFSETLGLSSTYYTK